MQVPEQYRIRSGRMASDARFGNNGAFMGLTEQLQRLGKTGKGRE
jgi:hypothetical protein